MYICIYLNIDVNFLCRMKISKISLVVVDFLTVSSRTGSMEHPFDRFFRFCMVLLYSRKTFGFLISSVETMKGRFTQVRCIRWDILCTSKTFKQFPPICILNRLYFTLSLLADVSFSFANSSIWFPTNGLVVKSSCSMTQVANRQLLLVMLEYHLVRPKCRMA